MQILLDGYSRYNNLMIVGLLFSEYSNDKGLCNKTFPAAAHVWNVRQAERYLKIDFGKWCVYEQAFGSNETPRFSVLRICKKRILMGQPNHTGV